MISNKANKIANGCRFCWMCRHICPVGLATGREEFTPRARGLMVSMMTRGQAMDESTAEAMYSCALCGSCTNDCVTGYDPTVFIREARTEAVVQGLLPKNVKAVVDRALEGGYIVEGEDCSELAAAVAAIPKTAEVALVLGEVATKKAQKTALAYMSLLKKAGVSFTLLANDKTGGMLFDLVGFVDEVKTEADKFAASVKATGAKTLVALEAVDARTLKIQYKEWNVTLDAEVVTATAFAAELVKSGKLSPKKSAKVVACHDSSYLARDLDETEPVRELIASLDYELKEMFLNKKMAKSCGEAVLASYSPAIASKMAENLMSDAARTGAEFIVAESPSDFVQLSSVEGKVKALDIFEALCESC